MLYLIGTGLYYLNDLPLRAIDVISSCSEVFIERYTNLNDITFIEKLKKITGKNIEVIGREEVESSLITDKAVDKDIALLIPGDPLAATTHFSLVEECYQKNIAVK
jgi:diphthamide biosynthesis methyltransferase